MVEPTDSKNKIKQARIDALSLKLLNHSITPEETDELDELLEEEEKSSTEDKGGASKDKGNK